jgi:hypothetical protein
MWQTCPERELVMGGALLSLRDIGILPNRDMATLIHNTKASCVYLCDDIQLCPVLV